tara:strand:- start:51 stop:245 length:195 start_codon:yes stop_codon:yes gene_type:complete
MKDNICITEFDIHNIINQISNTLLESTGEQIKKNELIELQNLFNHINTNLIDKQYQIILKNLKK